MTSSAPPTRAGGEGQGGSASAGSSSETQDYVVVKGCTKCRGSPAEGDKLRYCAACLWVSYCGEACQRADWPEHKLTCAQQKLWREQAQASAAGGQGTMATRTDDTLKIMKSVPGLQAKLSAVAWASRAESPLVVVDFSKCPSSDGSDTHQPLAPDVTVEPRHVWGRRVERAIVDSLKLHFDRPSFCPDKHFFTLIIRRAIGAPATCVQVLCTDFPEDVMDLDTRTRDTVMAAMSTG